MNQNRQINESLRGTGCILIRNEKKNHYFFLAKQYKNNKCVLIDISSDTHGFINNLIVITDQIVYEKEIETTKGIRNKINLTSHIYDQKITGINIDPEIKDELLQNRLLLYTNEDAIKYGLPQDYAICDKVKIKK